MSRRARFWDGRVKEKTRKNRQKIEHRDDQEEHNAEKNNLGVAFPNGLKISAAGQVAIMVVCLTFVALYFCEKFTRIVMCICARLNRAPTIPRNQR